MMVESEEASNNPSYQGPPQELTETLDLCDAYATLIRLNRFGTALAVGCHSGEIHVVDYTSKSVVVIIREHSHTITALDWSHNGRRIASADDNGLITIYDIVLRKTIVYYFSDRSYNAILFRPKSNDEFAILRIRDSQITIHKTIDAEKTEKPLEYRSVKSIADDNVTCMAYSQKGTHIIAGTSKSHLILFDAATGQYIKHVKQSNNHQIRQIYVSRNSDYIATNSSDRSIRLFYFSKLLSSKCGELVTTEARYTDSVSKRNYMYISMSPDARFLCSTENNSHEITIWDLRTNSLTPVLRGKVVGDAPTDLIWHNHRMEILTVAKGKVNVFGRRIVTSMSAFAPDFKEISTNVTYKEKEGEFDEKDEDMTEPPTSPMAEIEVDIETVQATEMPWRSIDEDECDLNDPSMGDEAPLLLIPAKYDAIPVDPDDANEPEAEYEILLEAEVENYVRRRALETAMEQKEVFLKPLLPVDPVSTGRTKASRSYNDDYQPMSTRGPRAKKARFA